MNFPGQDGADGSVTLATDNIEEGPVEGGDGSGAPKVEVVEATGAVPGGSRATLRRRNMRKWAMQKALRLMAAYELGPPGLTKYTGDDEEGQGDAEPMDVKAELDFAGGEKSHDSNLLDVIHDRLAMLSTRVSKAPVWVPKHEVTVAHEDGELAVELWEQIGIMRTVMCVAFADVT